MNPLARHYSRFRVAERLLLTGHSHQAWPDVAFDAQQRAWLDAAELVDDKWTRAAEVAEEVRAGWRRLLGDPHATIALGQNTHELVVRLLSAVLPMFRGAAFDSEAQRLAQAREAPRDVHSPDPTSARPTRPTRLVTTDGEFHSIRRQLDRLAEEGVPVIRIAARPVETLAARLAAAVDDRTACVLVSSVLFETAEIVPDLGVLASACDRFGATLLVDAYHHLNVVPFDVTTMGLNDAFIVGGGYKYCQLGEGNCFLRVPDGSELRPVITGWFSEFGEIAASPSTRLHRPSRGPGDDRPARGSGAGKVRYGAGAARFAGATYDPTSHYRAAAVFAFHQRMALTPQRLREISQHQLERLVGAFGDLDLDPRRARIEPMPPARRAGFLAIRSPEAGPLVSQLRARGVLADSRGDILRFGPAPYLSDAQLQDAIRILGRCLSHP